MDVVQWIVPGGLSDGSAATEVGVCFAPAWADRLPSQHTASSRAALRRRSAPLVSRHLPRPLAVAVRADVDDDDTAITLPDAPGQVCLRLSLDAAGEPLIPADASDVHFASVFSEFIGVTVDLCEAAGLPVMGVCPANERRALDVVLGGLRGQSRSRLADALLLLSAAVSLAALSRGFSAQGALLLPERKIIAVDGAIEASL